MAIVAVEVVQVREHADHEQVDDDGKAEGDGRLEAVVVQSLADAVGGLAVRLLEVAVHFPREDEGRVQEQVVRHDHGADHPHRRLEVLRARHPRDERAFPHLALRRQVREVQEAEREHHQRDEHAEQRLYLADAVLVQQHEQEAVGGGDETASVDRNTPAREDLDRNCRAHHLLAVRADDRNLHHDPERVAQRLRVRGAVLRKVAPGDDAELRADVLEDEAHERGHKQYPQQLVLPAGTQLQVGLQVAGVKVRDGHEEAGPGEKPELLEGEDDVAGGLKVLPAAHRRDGALDVSLRLHDLLLLSDGGVDGLGIIEGSLLVAHW
eukprot:Rhum_TRINITY_DN4471_c0_g1::Rhum_TRINITY_DN4471_c0_g1_i1::g.14591::m.14591